MGKKVADVEVEIQDLTYGDSQQWKWRNVTDVDIKYDPAPDGTYEWVTVKFLRRT